MGEPQQDFGLALGEIRRRLDAIEKTVAELKQAPRPAVPPPLPTEPRRVAADVFHQGTAPARDLTEPWRLAPARPSAETGVATVGSCQNAAPAAPASIFPDVLTPARVPLIRQAPAAPPAPATPPPAKLSLEQRLGTRWLLYVGIVVLLLAGVFFFKYAIDEGWISPARRLLGGTLFALAIIGLGEWLLLKRGMRLFAAGLMGYAIAQLYFVVFLASPNGWYHLVSSPVAFGLMCAVTALGAGLSLQTRMLSTAVIALLGAIATPALLSTGEDRQVLLMSYLLVVDAGFLAVALARRWQVLAPLALAGTIALFFGWGVQHYKSDAAGVTNLFCWAFLAEFVVCVVVGCATGRLFDALAQGLLIAAGAAAIVLWGETCNRDGMFAGTMGLVVLALLLSLWRKWNVIRMAAFVGVVSAMAFKVNSLGLNNLTYAANDYWSLSLWAWGFFLIFTADVWVRVAARIRSVEAVDASIVSLAMAGMFAVTCWLLDPHCHAWMGAYAAGLGAAAIGASIFLRRSWQRGGLSVAYLAQGLALLVLAVPIQFDRSTVTLVWAAQGVVAAVLARRFGNVLLHIASLAALAFAAMHLYAFDLRAGEALRQQAVVLLGSPIAWNVLVAAGVALAMLAAAATYSWRDAIGVDSPLFTVCILLFIAAFVIFAERTAADLPLAGATWAWLIFAVVVAAWGCWRRDNLFASAGAVLLIVAAIKWAVYDSILRLSGESPAATPFWNWQAAAGIAIAAALFAHARMARRAPWVASPGNTAMRPAIDVLAAVLVVYAGSVEIVRYFSDAPAGRWTDPFQAMHAALSVWWAAYAAVLLALGFGFRSRSTRYLALVLFAATVAKVFLVDMREVKAVYRILSFLCLGGLLVAASWLYNRFFRERLRSPQSGEPAAPPEAPP